MSKKYTNKKAKRDYAKEFTDKMIGLIESGDFSAWRKPWANGKRQTPQRS